MSTRYRSVRRILAFALMAAFAAPLVAAPPARAATDTVDPMDPPGLPELLPTILPAVVNIKVLYPIDPNAPPPGPNQPPRKRELGSGFIVSPDGMIVTARHVVEGGIDFTVTFADGTQTKADLLFEGVQLDIALLKARADHPLPVVKIGDSNKVRQGDPVFAIGNPLGLKSSVTHGIISALDRDIEDSAVDHFMQTDTPVNPGNSGGPLFNARGEVIGVNIAIYTSLAGSGSQGLAFVMPVNDAAFVLRHWHQTGDARPGWIGANVQALTPELATALGYPHQLGTVVSWVDAGSPAAKAGLRIGDVVLTYGGVAMPEARSLRRAVAMDMPGTKEAMTIWREGKELTVQIDTEYWPGWHVAVPKKGIQSQTEKPPANLGLTLAELDAATRAQMKLTATKAGVKVTKVTPQSDAAVLGITNGTVILGAGHDPVTSVAAFWNHVKEVRQQKKPYVVVLIQNGANKSLVALPLGS